MSTIPFNHLKSKVQEPLVKPTRSIWQLAREHVFSQRNNWHFFKSQMGLFGGTETARISKLGHGIPFAMNKEKESPNIGEVKSESGKQYIFLETTIGKPRWHSHEELVTMAKEGKKIPEIAKKKMPTLAKEEEVKSKKPIAKHGDKIRFKDDEENAEWTILRTREEKGKNEYRIKYDNGKKGSEHSIFQMWLAQDDITHINGKPLKTFEEAKPKDQLSENINKRVDEEKKKEAPTLKTLMTTQAEVLKLAEIPEEDIGMYALNSLADGAKLRSYSTEVIKGEMTAQQAADKVKGDYAKMKEGMKPTNAGELPSTGKEPTSIEKAKKDIERARELMKEAPEKEEPDSGIKTKADYQRYIDETQAWIDKKEKSESDKDTLPVLPSEKDVKEGDTKQINGITYELKRGESSEFRWHRMTEEDKSKSETVSMPKSELIDEHKNLVKVLEIGTEEERKAEAEKQKKELEGYEEGMDEGTPEDEPERSLKELVEEHLNEKQENKKFKDVGNRVGGSKKEIAAIKVLTMDDLSKLDNATAYKIVTKDRILADIDPTAEKAAGVESGAAYLKKKLREALMARPLNSQEARKKYLELIPKIFDKIDSCKTVEELSNLRSDYFDIWQNFRGKGLKIYFKGDNNNNLVDILGKEFTNLIGRNSDSAKEHWKEARLMSPVSQEESDKHYKQYDEAKKNAFKVNKDRMDAYTPEQWENYFKNDPMVTYSFTRRQLADQKKNEPEKYQEAIEKYKAQDYKNNEIRNEVMPYLKWIAQSPSYAAREENWKWAEPKAEEKKVIQKAKDELKIHDNPPLAFIKRTNGREVKNSDISAEALTKKYGFKSVQLGNYVKDVEAKEHIRHFVESMNDLEDVLGIDIKKMNELSGLSIAFGARGGGRSSAHYEPMSKIINLTKSMADGAVAHEFFHCIDHLMGGMREGTRTENIFLSQTPEESKGKLGEAMKGVMDAIKKGDNVVTKPFQPNEQKYTYASIRRNFEQKGFEFTKNDIMRYVKDTSDLGQAEDYFKYLATLSGKPITVDFETRRSKFYDGALSFKSDYWRRPLEMFARAAESYIQDKIMSKGMYNNYLVGGNNIQQPDRKWENTGYLTMAYPQGEERTKINEAFDKLIEAMKEEMGLAATPKEGKRISSEVQMQKSLYNPGVFETMFRRLR